MESLDIAAAQGARVLQHDSDTDSDVLLVLEEEEWELPELPVAVPQPEVASIRSRPVAPLLPRPPRVLAPCPPERQHRRVAPKLEIGSWEGRSLYIRLSMTYGVWWYDMRAVCLCHAGNCSLSRSCRRGRPIGLLAAWLLHGLRPECESKQMHRAYNPSYDERVAARQHFKSLEGSAEWFRAEASPGSGPEEPVEDTS